MTHRTEHGRHVFACNTPGCFAEVDTREGRFEAAVRILRAKGWTCSRSWSSKQWRHYCAECNGS